MIDYFCSLVIHLYISMQKTPLIILAGVIVIVVAVWFFNNSETETVVQNTDTSAAQELTPINPAIQTEEEVNVIVEPEVVTESPTDNVADTAVVQELPTPEPAPLAAGTYTKYSPDKVASADGDVVLFFKADWCPSCRVLDSDIKNNLSNIPSGVTILEVNYDKETALKQKYGITTQHSLVQVDNSGNQIKKWSGSPRLSSVIAEL